MTKLRTYDSSKSHIHPLGNNLVVRRARGEQLTESGLVASVGSTKQRRGEVLAIGPGKQLDFTGDRAPMSVSPGDVVVWPEHVDGVRVLVDGEELLVIPEDAVCAVITDQAIGS
jgi:co-chaperonin GroES (HSP10)